LPKRSPRTSGIEPGGKLQPASDRKATSKEDVKEAQQVSGNWALPKPKKKVIVRVKDGVNQKVSAPSCANTRVGLDAERIETAPIWGTLRSADVNVTPKYKI